MIDWISLQQILTLPDTVQQTAERVEKVAVSMAERYVGRVLSQQAVVDTVRVSPRGRIVLPSWPVSAIARITYDGKDTAWEAIDLSLGLVHLTDVPAHVIGPLNSRYVECTYTGGYHPVPADVQQAVIDITSWQLKRILGDTIGATNRTIEGGYAEGFEMRMPLSARTILDGYRSAAC